MKRDKRKQSIYISTEVLNEIHDEARRQDRTMSWIVQKALALALAEIRAMPTPPPATEVEEESAPAVDAACERCVVGTPLGRSKNCPQCNEMIDRVILRARTEMSNVEIAEMLNAPLTMVEQRKSRALRNGSAL